MLDPHVVVEGGRKVEEVAMLAVADARIEKDHGPSTRQGVMNFSLLFLRMSPTFNGYSHKGVKMSTKFFRDGQSPFIGRKLNKSAFS